MYKEEGKIGLHKEKLVLFFQCKNDFKFKLRELNRSRNADPCATISDGRKEKVNRINTWYYIPNTFYNKGQKISHHYIISKSNIRLKINVTLINNYFWLEHYTNNLIYTHLNQQGLYNCLALFYIDGYVSLNIF